MDNPIRSNGYEKYVIQIGWFQPEPNLLFAVMGQDILAKNKKQAEQLMKLLYPQSLGVGLPFLCPIVEEIEEEEDEEDLIDKYLHPKENKIDLIHPN